MAAQFRCSSKPGKGRVVRRDGDLAQVDASLIRDDGEIAATATATATVIPLDQAPTAV